MEFSLAGLGLPDESPFELDFADGGRAGDDVVELEEFINDDFEGSSAEAMRPLLELGVRFAMPIPRRPSSLLPQENTSPFAVTTRLWLEL